MYNGAWLFSVQGNLEQKPIAHNLWNDVSFGESCFTLTLGQTYSWHIFVWILLVEFNVWAKKLESPFYPPINPDMSRTHRMSIRFELIAFKIQMSINGNCSHLHERKWCKNDFVRIMSFVIHARIFIGRIQFIFHVHFIGGKWKNRSRRRTQVCPFHPE